MDTISASERNTSYLPIFALILGAIGLVLGGIALAKTSSATKEIAAARKDLTEQISGVSASIPAIEKMVADADRGIKSLQRGTQDGFNTVGGELANLRGSVTKLEEAAKAPPPKAAGKAASGEPVVAGPGEYVIKGGDTGAKIARSQGFTLADLQTVNPGVNWTALKIGQKIKLPKK